jgi:hypothetical protein
MFCYIQDLRRGDFVLDLCFRQKTTAATRRFDVAFVILIQEFAKNRHQMG